MCCPCSQHAILLYAMRFVIPQCGSLQGSTQLLKLDICYAGGITSLFYSGTRVLSEKENRYTDMWVMGEGEGLETGVARARKCVNKAR